MWLEHKEDEEQKQQETQRKRKSEAADRGQIVRALYVLLSKVFNLCPIGKWLTI